MLTLHKSAWYIAQLLQPQSYAHPVTRIELRETHISWVILTGPFAYKIKKPLKLDFIDTSTLELRERYCREELRLNQRLAPELYLDVVPVTRTGGRLSFGGQGPVIDYAVRMQQFAAADELAQLLPRGEVSPDEITALADSLAHFHLCAPGAAWTGRHDKTGQMRDFVLGNLAQLNAALESGELHDALRGLIAWTQEMIGSLEESFCERERCGYIRECHGDLHAGNIVRWRGRLVPFDALEFDPKLRWTDVLNDVAFLVMDLVSHERHDLAFAFASRYLEITGDYDGVRLLPFYAVYRALVRAKVDALTMQTLPDQAAQFSQRLQRRVRTALEWTQPRRPVLVIMHGVSGSGKSWLSERLITALPALRVRSDLERKRLAGVSPLQRSGAARGIYAAEFSHRTYARLAGCAENCLRAGLSVIVDATFLDAADRELFSDLARRLAAPYVIGSCAADAATLAARILQRAREREDPSDADLHVLDAQLREFQPFTIAEQSHVISVDTAQPDAAARIVAAVKLADGVR